MDAEGFAGLVIPSGIATDDTTKFFIQDVIDKESLVSLFDFENKGIFPNVHSSFKFCLFTAASGMQPLAEKAQFVFFAHDVEDIQDVEKRFTLEPGDIALLNPNTRTIPVFRSRADAELTKFIYRHVPVLIREGPPEVNSWGIQFATMFHMSNDSGLFRTAAQLATDGFAREASDWVSLDGRRYVPLYEAKMIHQFDHRWATFDGADSRDVTEAEKCNARFEPIPRYWIPESEVTVKLTNENWDRRWLLGVRGIARLRYPLIFKRGRKARRRLRFGVEVVRIARLAAAAWPLACWE